MPPPCYRLFGQTAKTVFTFQTRVKHASAHLILLSIEALLRMHTPLEHRWRSPLLVVAEPAGATQKNFQQIKR